MNDKEIEKGYQLVIENAKSLIDEANLLLANDYCARAYSLTQLATEEIGKSSILLRAIFEYYMGVTIDFKYLKGLGFTKHQEKTKESLKPELIAIWLFEQSMKKKTDLRSGLVEDFNQIEELNDLKNNSLYVGVKDDRFFSPKEIITKEMARNLIEKAKLRLAAAEPLFRPLDAMKDAALKLKELNANPEREAEFSKRMSEEFGIGFAE